MSKPGRKKGIASVILAIFGFAVLADDSIGRMQKFEALMPAPVRPYLPMIYGALFLASLLLIRSQHQDEIESLSQPDVGVLVDKVLRLEAQITAQGRHLSETQAAAMTRVLREGRTRLRQKLIDEKIATAEEVDNEPMIIRLISLGEDNEAKIFRKELAIVFEASGFRAAEHQMMSLGQDEVFFGAVTIATNRPENIVRPFVVDSFRAAGVAYREGDEPATNLFFGKPFDGRLLACTVIVA